VIFTVLKNQASLNQMLPFQVPAVEGTFVLHASVPVSVRFFRLVSETNMRWVVHQARFRSRGLPLSESIMSESVSVSVRERVSVCHCAVCESVCKRDCE